MSATEVETPRAEPTSQSSKRKATVAEIQVDLQAPEPPSKKARRALKKGKPTHTKSKDDNDNNDLDDDDADGNNKKGKKEKARSEHGVWIGNLPFRLTAAELRKWLVDNAGGVISDTSITRVKLPTVKDAAGRDKKEKAANKGFAYVDFADLSTKVAAIALSETDMQGRKLLIKDAKSFEGRPAKEKKEAEEGKDGAKGEVGAKTAQESNASRKVFVGNLSFKTTQEDLERNFEKCGEIEWAKLATFEDTGKCKGFGWVKFKEAEAAAWAVKGFVKVKEAVETEADFDDDESDSDDDGKKNEKKNEKKEGNKDGGQQQGKQFKTRKWWVNRLLGRELKLELAEDDQLRYKKRFGKDAKRNSEGGEAKTRQNGAGEERRRPEPREVEMKASSQDLNVARLTGAVVQHTGTKVTFD